LLVFIHGGYWQRNEKKRFSFVAAEPGSRGINVAVPGYTLVAAHCRSDPGDDRVAPIDRLAEPTQIMPVRA
jgi:hypothetical protein